VRDVYAHMLNTEQRVEARRPEISSDNHHANYTSRPGGGRAPPYQPRQEQPAPYNAPAPVPNGGRPQGQQGRPMSTGGTRPICQICTKPGHVASCCFKRYDKNYLGAGNDGATRNDSSPPSVPRLRGLHRPTLSTLPGTPTRGRRITSPTTSTTLP
jgi:hypothetical protein